MSAGDEAANPGEINWIPLGASWAAPALYSEERLTEEAAFIAYHFHWDLERILSLEHAERRRWTEEISRINAQINDQSGALASM